MMKKNHASPLTHIWMLLVLLICGAVICVLSLTAQSSKNASHRIFAQKIVDDTLAAHSEIEGLELSATPPNKTDCEPLRSTIQRKSAKNATKKTSPP